MPSAIAVALNRRHALAIDDGLAIRRALHEAGIAGQMLKILRTQDVVIELIHANVLTIEQADGIKLDWETHHRFRIAALSFASLL